MRILSFFAISALLASHLGAGLIYVYIAPNPTDLFGAYDTQANDFSGLVTQSRELYGLAFNGGTLYDISGQDDQVLYTVNTGSGAVTLVGALGANGYPTLESLPGGGVLDAIAPGNLLLTVDPSVDDGTPSGP